jgi:hypothetical protein
MYTSLNTKRVRAALDAAESGIEVAEYCGIVPVFTYAVPSSHVSHYAVETKKMRDILLASNETKIKSLIEKWELLKYLDKNGKLTAFDKYEMRNTDGAIRRVDDNNKKRRIEGVAPKLSVTIDGTTIRVPIERHRAYMSTSSMSCRRNVFGFSDRIMKPRRFWAFLFKWSRTPRLSTGHARSKSTGKQRAKRRVRNITLSMWRPLR